MATFILNEKNTIGNHFLGQLRDVEVQKDSMRFRRNLERIGELLAYEISKTLPYQTKEVPTPLGTASIPMIEKKVVLATIMRAGLPMHQGFLNYFDNAGNAFVSAYRKHHKDGSFEIKMEYISCPDLNDSILMLVDPMLATGASMEIVLREMLNIGTPQQIHIAAAIASKEGVEFIKRKFPQAHLWLGAVDEELTAKSYIVPGLGDAGDLSYGNKIQE